MTTTTDDYTRLDDSSDGMTQPIAEDRSETDEQEVARPLFYPNAEAWVHGWLLPHYRRNPNTRRWRADWWLIEEVQLIIESLWESWEYFRYEGATGLLVYLRDYFYPMMDVINSPDGPLWNYEPPRETAVPEMWEATPAPEGMYRTEGDPEET